MHGSRRAGGSAARRVAPAVLVVAALVASLAGGGRSGGGSQPVQSLGPSPAYWVRPAGPALIATNPVYRLAERFGPARVTLTTSTGTVTFVVGGTRAAAQNRVSYSRGPVTEWFVNGAAGLEQGFTLRAPPATVSVRVAGSLRPRVRSGGVDFVDARGGVAMHYSGPTATDASGRKLPARLTLSGRTIVLSVAAAGARYPITIQ